VFASSSGFVAPPLPLSSQKQLDRDRNSPAARLWPNTQEDLQAEASASAVLLSARNVRVGLVKMADQEPRLRRARTAAIVALVVVAATTLVDAPLLRGHVLLLDWQVSSVGPLLSRSARGLDGGVTSGVPGSELFILIGRLPGHPGGWLPFAVFFPLAAYGAARLIGHRCLQRVVGAILYAGNPFVFERVAVGQVGVLIGYALLPFVIASLLQPALSEPRPRAPLATAAWWAAMAALSVHYLWIVGIVWLAEMAIRLRRPLRATVHQTWTLLLVVLLSAYLFLAQLGQPRPVTVGAKDVAAYATRSDPDLGLYGNVLGLYGFWRQGPRLPKDAVPVWPALLAAILVIAAIGAWSALRDPARRPLAGVLLLSGTAGYFLALGTQGPTEPLFRFLFDHVPFFQVMREPEKFLCLTALAYAVLFGWGVGQLLTWARQDRAMRLAIAVLAVALPLAYSPTFINGLSGQVTGVTVPAGFDQADRLMGDGPEQVLVLPWHQYLSFPWTGRVVANPAPALFHRDVIVGDDVELPGVYSTSTSSRSSYLQGLYAQGGAQQGFGGKVARLGVGYVVVAKTLDWQAFDWLHGQADLRVALDTPDLTVYQVTTRVALGARIGSDGTRGVAVTKRSTVRYDVPAGPSGRVELAEPYDPSWRLDGAEPVRTEQGTMRFFTGPGATSVRFVHWPVTLAGYIVSLVTALVLAALLVVDRIRRRRRQGNRLELGETAGTTS